MAQDGHQLKMGTYKHSLVSIDKRNFELSWSQTHKHTHTDKQTHIQDRLQYTAPLSLARRRQNYNEYTEINNTVAN